MGGWNQGCGSGELNEMKNNDTRFNDDFSFLARDPPNRPGLFWDLHLLLFVRLVQDRGFCPCLLMVTISLVIDPLN